MMVDPVQEVIDSGTKLLVGKKLVSVTRSVDDYIRWTFENGAYVEWYSGVPRRTFEPWEEATNGRTR